MFRSVRSTKMWSRSSARCEVAAAAHVLHEPCQRARTAAPGGARPPRARRARGPGCSRAPRARGPRCPPSGGPPARSPPGRGSSRARARVSSGPPAEPLTRVPQLESSARSRRTGPSAAVTAALSSVTRRSPPRLRLSRANVRGSGSTQTIRAAGKRPRNQSAAWPAFEPRSTITSGSASATTAYSPASKMSSRANSSLASLNQKTRVVRPPAAGAPAGPARVRRGA